MASRTIATILSTDYNMGAAGIEKIVTLTSTQTLTTMASRTLYVVAPPTAANITITLPAAGTQVAYSYFVLDGTGGGDGILSSASHIGGAATLTLSVDADSVLLKDDGTTYLVMTDNRLSLFPTLAGSNTFTGTTNTFSNPVVVATPTGATHAVTKAIADTHGVLTGANSWSGANTFTNATTSMGDVTKYNKALDQVDAVTTICSNDAILEISWKNGTALGYVKVKADITNTTVTEITRSSSKSLGYTSGSGSDIDIYVNGGDVEMIDTTATIVTIRIDGYYIK